MSTTKRRKTTEDFKRVRTDRSRGDDGQVNVLYRRGANANSLFLTERCNSRCLMCSPPPRDDDDGWRVDELLELIGLIDDDLPQLGFTGGEPTLLGPRLAELIRACKAALPRTGRTRPRHQNPRATGRSPEIRNTGIRS
jgi:hypothetical protein